MAEYNIKTFAGMYELIDELRLTWKSTYMMQNKHQFVENILSSGLHETA